MNRHPHTGRRFSTQAVSSVAERPAVPSAPVGTAIVLLVDDDADCRLLVRDAVEEQSDELEQVQVHEVEDGAAALRFLRQEGEFGDAPRPALILLDMEMPGLDGLETLRRIKADAALREIPTVMLTGCATEDLIRAATRAGANSYTVKPADAQKLIEAVAISARYWLHVHQSPDRHRPQSECRR